MKLNPHVKLALMTGAGATLPIIAPLLYDLMAGIPTPDWRANIAKGVMGGLTAAYGYLKTNPYDTKLGPNMVASTGDQKLVTNTAEMDKITQEAAGK